MGAEIFRKKSLDKIKSPENLDDYIKVSNPGVWLVLIAIIAILIGTVIWSIFGYIDSYIKVDALADNGNVTCYVSEEDLECIENGLEVKIGDVTGKITYFTDHS